MPTSISPASGEVGLETPLIGVADLETKPGLDPFQSTVLAALCQFATEKMMRLKLTTISNRELPIVILAGLDHIAAILAAVGHRLFAKHMLASFRSADRELSVHAVGQHDVDHVDRIIVGQFVEVVIVVNIAAIDAVLGRPFLFLGRSPRHDAFQLGNLGRLQRRSNLIGAQAAEPHQCKINGRLGLSCAGRMDTHRSGCGQSGGRLQELSASRGHVSPLDPRSEC